MNDMYAGRSPTERGDCEPDEDPLVTENNRLTDRIAELTAEVARLKDALRPFADCAEVFDDHRRGGTMPSSGEFQSWPRVDRDFILTVEHLRDARNALKEGK